MATKSSSKKNLSNNNFIIVAVLITLVVVGITTLVGKGLVTTIIRDTKVITKKSAANDQLKKNLEAAPKLVEAYEQLGDTKRIIAHALPNTSDFSGLIAQLENMQGVSGIELKSISPASNTGAVDAVSTASDKLSQPQQYVFGVSTSGSYDSLLKFLTAIQNSVRPLKVNTIQISGSGSALTFTIDLSTYYQNVATIPYKLEVVK